MGVLEEGIEQPVGLSSWGLTGGGRISDCGGWGIGNLGCGLWDTEGTCPGR